MADFDIGSILNSLSPEDIENIKKAASGFLGNMGETQEKPKEKKQENNGMPFPDGLSGFLAL